ncbi:MAG: heavy-metal-associated domain-containing protein [Deltaproteobacteria bacterium]|nr:heavy-metal-associated domain-containing protein [Deltaproteobacteria bacterium]
MARLLVLTLMLAASAFAKKPERLLAVKFTVQHAYRCTTCAGKIAAILKTVDGVRDARSVAAQDAAVAIFESGRADLDEMKRALAREGFAVRLTWGPAAVQRDGSFEDVPLDEVPHRRPTLKEKLEAPTAKAPAGKGFRPPAVETTPESGR